MILFLFHMRVISPDVVEQVCQVYYHTLRLFQEPGWLGGGCVVNIADPRDVLIYERWGDLTALRAWLRSAARREAHAQAAPFIVGQPEETIFQDVG